MYRLALTDGMGRPKKINEHLSLNITNLQKEQAFFVCFFSSSPCYLEII